MDEQETVFPEPMSRNEAILQNMLGADNALEEPMSRIETLLLLLLEKLEELEQKIDGQDSTQEDNGNG